MPLGEFELIERFFAHRGPQRRDVSLGIGDDAALVRVPPGTELVVTVDTIVAGVHFPAEASPADIGYRAMVVNLSDIAAMGATPAWATLALTLPAAQESWLEDFCSAFFALASAHDVMLVGGDTTSGPLSVTVQIMGHVPIGKALKRSGARVGDLIVVSGHVGDAAGGLELLQRRSATEPHRDQLVARFLRPEPRIALGLALRDVASAAIDISDGLAADLTHILESSGVGARLDLDALPLSEALAASFDSQRALELALGGGDDYELCLTVPPQRAPMLAEVVATVGCPLTRVGIIETRPGLRCMRGGISVTPAQLGYQHFSG